MLMSDGLEIAWDVSTDYAPSACVALVVLSRQTEMFQSALSEWRYVTENECRRLLNIG